MFCSYEPPSLEVAPGAFKHIVAIVRAFETQQSACRLPPKRVLTLNLEVPEAWMVEATKSVYDLDNLRLVSRSCVAPCLVMCMISTTCAW